MKQAVKSVEEIKAILKEHKAEVVRKYRVSEIGIFGSFVRGEQKEKSDVDILVSFSGSLDVFKYMELEDYLKKLLHRKVDLVRKGAIRPELKKRILEEAVYV
ncbi:MAG: nucleotidyltransferase family protein [Dissulfurispiraceae bacterium]|jgi:predicted nucleotidyltransferase